MVMVIGLLVYIVPMAVLVFLMPSWRSLAVAVVACAVAYWLLMPIPDISCSNPDFCAGTMVVDNLMRPFVLICWASLAGAAALKAVMLKSKASVMQIDNRMGR